MLEVKGVKILAHNGPLPAAVVFDMDGLMLDTEKIFQQAWQDAAHEFGYHIPEELFYRLVGLRTEDCEAMILEALGDTFPLQTFHTRWMAIWIEIAETDGIELKPGLLELLDRIDSLGIPKAVATSSTRPEATRCLGSSGLDRRFSVVVTGDEVEHGKPAPDIFREAATRLGVDASSCWAFEDSSPGAIAASGAGMSVYIVPDLKEPTTEAAAVATDILPTLHEALSLLS